MRETTRQERISIVTKGITDRLTVVFTEQFALYPELAQPQNKANVLQATRELGLSVMPDAAKADKAFVEAADQACERAYEAAKLATPADKTDE